MLALMVQMMEARLMKQLVEAIKDLVTHINIDCSYAHGFQIQALDTAQVTLVRIQLPVSGFDSFQCQPPNADSNAGTVTLGIHLDWFSKVLKHSTNEQSLSLHYFTDNPDHLTVTMETDESLRGICKSTGFEMRLVEVEQDAWELPDTEWDYTVSMYSTEFQRVCNECISFADTVKLIITPHTMEWQVSGGSGSGVILFRHSEEHVVRNDAENTDRDDGSASKRRKRTLAKKQSKSSEQTTLVQIEASDTRPDRIELTFCLKYLSMFGKAAPLSERVYLYLKSATPLQVEYPFSSGGSLQFYLAPKIQDVL